MRGRLANTVRLRVAAETQPLIRLRAGPQTPSPKGEGISSQKLPPSLQNGYSPRPLHILLLTACAGGFCMLERLSLFCLGGGAYAALELAWRGTTHWTMFLAGGVCLCLWQSRRPWARRASAGWSWLWARSAAAFCISPSGIMPMSGATWRAWSARATPFTGFCSAGGSFSCYGALKVPFITLKNRYRRVKVQIIVLSIWYNKDIPDKKGGTYHDPAVQIRRRPH